MKILTTVPYTKQVYYFGLVVIVPVWTRFLAVDFDRSADAFMLRAYYHEPVFNDLVEGWFYQPENDHRYQDVCTVALECLPPEQTLLRYI